MYLIIRNSVLWSARLLKQTRSSLIPFKQRCEESKMMSASRHETSACCRPLHAHCCRGSYIRLSKYNDVSAAINHSLKWQRPRVWCGEWHRPSLMNSSCRQQRPALTHLMFLCSADSQAPSRLSADLAQYWLAKGSVYKLRPCRIWRILTKVYNTQKYWDSGLSIVRNSKHKKT
jgi:hypothetical protein